MPGMVLHIWDLGFWCLRTDICCLLLIWKQFEAGMTGGEAWWEFWPGSCSVVLGKVVKVNVFILKTG
jgi:hypothetical protein